MKQNDQQDFKNPALSRRRIALWIVVIILFSSCKKDPDKKILEWLDKDGYSSLTLTAEDMATKRGEQDGSNWTIPQNFSDGAFIISPELSQLGAGSGKLTILLKTPQNAAQSEKVATIRIFDTNTNKLISIKELFRNDFSYNNTFQPFELYFETNEASAIELRVIWHGGTDLSFSTATFEMYRHQPGMPELVNQAGVSNDIAQNLANRALVGLGFNPSDPDGPVKNDLVFVGQYYIAWIDQTGFYGKMNGLWLLNGLAGEALDFLHLDNGRPVNFLGVAEKGDGQWMENYVGSEHYELPGLMYDEGKDAALYVGREFADWYSVNEAGTIRGKNLSWWTAAMKYRMGFSIYNKPIERTQSANQLYINFESPMTKESDGDLIKDGDRAHAHMLFADKIRYPFYIRTGYTLYGDRPYFERHYQYRNPAENPPFTTQEVGGWHLIGGLVITDYRSPYNYKVGLNKFVRLNEFAVSGLPVDQWANVAPQQNGPPDVLWHYGQSYTMSNNATFEAGNAIHVSAQSTGSRIVDMGGCTCFVHGGLEIGGGVMGGGALPIAPGQLSKKDTRHFLFPQGNDEMVDETVNVP
jgi:hypothetical protein